MNIKDWAVEYLMDILEGPFAEDEHGGKTYWGIAEKQSRKAFEQQFNHWPPIEDSARNFYELWWDRNYCYLLPPMAGAMWFWFTVHIGEPRARRVLQEALTQHLNSVQLRIDGVIGPRTQRAMLEAQGFPEFSRHFRAYISNWYQNNLPGFAYQQRLYPLV